MTFQAQPGTIQFRAITWLQTQPPGTEVTASIWGEAIGIEGPILATCIKPAIDAGAVRRRTKDGMKRPLWFSLGNGTPPLRELPDGEDAQDPLPQRRKAPDVKPVPGALLPGVRGNEPVLPAPLKVPKFTGETPEPAPSPPAGRPMTLQECVEAETKPRVLLPFDCWLSGVSGELVLQGVATNEDGDQVLTGDQVQRVRCLLLGVAP